MPEERKRGFHALEQRIHQMEEEDAKGESAGRSAPGQPGEKQPRQEPPGGRPLREK